MLETTKIPRDELQQYFDRFSKHFLKNESTIVTDVDILAGELGDQKEAEGARLGGITYDPKDNALEIELDGGVHRVFNPAEVWTAEETDGFVTAIEIIREDSTREVVRVRRLGIQARGDA